MAQPDSILIGQSQATDPVVAVHELHAQIHRPDAALVMFFCSAAYPREALAAELRRAFAGLPVIGCTTAGELGPAGYRSGSLVGCSLPASDFSAVTACIDGLQDFSLRRGLDCAERLLAGSTAVTDGAERFALMLIDGLCQREEPVAYAFQKALGRIPLIGGSAGDDLAFRQTWVYHDGAFRTDAAVLAIVASRRRFAVFKTQHFRTADERLVVTAANPAQRVVHELNGLPAAQEYARLIGVPVEALEPRTFAAAPVVVFIDGTDYVRSIRQAHADGSLTFYCAVELGMVLRVASASDMIEHLDEAIAGIRAEVGRPQLVLAFDCILRNLESSRKGCQEPLAERFRTHRIVGFSTYGEQYGGVHINHTLTGIAIAE